MSMMDTSNEVSREEVLQLIAEKESMEKQLLSLYSVLSKNGVGMTDPLVDSEDYPRSDIDVYEVRAARQRIICLRNDLRNMMVEIEEKLHALHAASKDSIEMCVPTERANTQPVAKVAWVAAHSPADRAGLIEGDEIVEFGSLNSSNFRSISDFSVVVQNSVGRKINVKLKRMGNFVNVHMIPASWSPGGGLLGCKIVELTENAM
ncbi:26S proteasome non-ATPase regulatory subunit 9 [Schistocerca americana]|uniref:26S proteasome non-ATPase regulatory subunit 9 n=1 Tax=Schistocerca americana TaxID=7009 RepID=UPI001F501A7C|nr:26S proteasome non-ATPase regulatory subunit 9 [Schistocerca americana]XP_049807252.1 26S proteasome non-ATPase regulatory subunit 9 [Schistocerca nitens]XP_049845852.1 26S proteasome non-ATPase regulatory subunit 9 [Schistocerca gregaria]